MPVRLGRPLEVSHTAARKESGKNGREGDFERLEADIYEELQELGCDVLVFRTELDTRPENSALRYRGMTR